MSQKIFNPGEVLYQYLPGRGLLKYTAVFGGFDFITVLDSSNQRHVLKKDLFGRTPAEAVEAFNASARAEIKDRRTRLKTTMRSLHYKYQWEGVSEGSEHLHQAYIRELERQRDEQIRFLLEHSDRYSPTYKCLTPRKPPPNDSTD